MLDLIEKLERAESGSQELDADIYQALRYARGLELGLPREHIAVWTHVGGGIVESHGSRAVVPPWTTSLDAVVALAQERSPLRGPINLTIAGSGFCAIEPVEPCADPVLAFGNTPPLALCIALLRALSHKEEADD